ncbi:UbiH/UbiF/VisC/COQ6 family ubiquinone biosynthesis hydroxylase [Govanella unica]|uniref:UbiH/UbiF/VisC/COQ6 family ubiquinone biosynthesis hydroxylase n=1 Tax=Govanella unica TaxID=2975056 RepID=A0A9X3Z5S9_9PROT|nr:UbiH/UbiF/VisC/COQ6 family ubiquinone biosynthesis hydroxylase [Govania unica]MDA5192436.1 UbiH/UbiF/VisC/COQ6 family ubiquinone biosynthesis hydroxylase [Govania unica]
MDRPTQFDVIISGGGMAGLTLALALGQSGLKVAAIDREAPAHQLDPVFDGRASAIALAGVRLFQGIGLWPHVAAHATPIDDIRITDRNSLLHVHFDHRALPAGQNAEPLGMMLENRHIRTGLQAALDACPQVTLFAPDSALNVTRGPARVEVTLASGQRLQAPLIVGAEGRNSSLRETAGIPVHDFPYDQIGIVVTAEHEKPHGNIAHERFLAGGPFAILPISGNRSSIVWTERTATAKALLSLDSRGFEAELQKRFGDFLGAVHVSGPRWSYPLTLHMVPRATDLRLALIGDAAHGIHPIAGQGLNLGLKDVAALAEAIVDAARIGQDLGSPDVLARYERWRRFDTVTLSFVTDLLNRLFMVEAAPLSLVRKLGLGLVNRLPAAKTLFMDHARGTMGDLPRLLRGEAL